MITIEEIYLAYFDCRKHKRRKPTAVTFEINYETNLRQLLDEVNNRTYKIGRSIAFCVTKPKLREVFAADFRDRIVHHLLINRINDLFEGYFHPSTYNCRKGKGVLYGVRDIDRQIKGVSYDYALPCYVLKCDLLGFFMSINKDILYDHLEKFLTERYKRDDLDHILWIAKTIIYNRPELNCRIKGNRDLFRQLPDNKTLFKSNGRGLPIGNLTSQIFANFYLSPLDNWLSKEFCGYGRYVDDFICISTNKEKLVQFIPKIKLFLKDKLLLNLHPDKIYLLEVHKGVSFIGSVIKPGRIYTGNATITNFQLKIKKMTSDDLEKIVKISNSYLGFLVHNASYNIRKRYVLQILQIAPGKMWADNHFKTVHLTKKSKQYAYIQQCHICSWT